MKYITKEYNHWLVEPHLREALAFCRAKEAARYALDKIWVDADSLTATNGKTLLNVVCQHEIEPGLYFMTADGFLLKYGGGDKYPEFRTLFLTEKDSKAVFMGRHLIEVAGCSPENNVLALLLRADVYFNIDCMQKILRLLYAIGEYAITAHVPTDSNAKVVMICGEIGALSFTFMQMGISLSPWETKLHGFGS